MPSTDSQLSEDTQRTVLEALMSLSQIATERRVHPNGLFRWTRLSGCGKLDALDRSWLIVSLAEGMSFVSPSTVGE